MLNSCLYDNYDINMSVLHDYYVTCKTLCIPNEVLLIILFYGIDRIQSLY